MDAFANSNGLGLTASHQLSYNTWVHWHSSTLLAHTSTRTVRVALAGCVASTTCFPVCSDATVCPSSRVLVVSLRSPPLDAQLVGEYRACQWSCHRTEERLEPSRCPAAPVRLCGERAVCAVLRVQHVGPILAGVFSVDAYHSGSKSSHWDIYYCAPLAHNITCLRWPLGTFPHHHSPGRLAACPPMSLCIVQANKAVFGVEYTGTPSSFCPTVNFKRMSVIKKSLGLTAKPYTSCVPAASSAGLNTTT